MAVDRPGWRHVPDAYRLLGQLAEPVELLPDMLEHIQESCGVPTAVPQQRWNVHMPYLG